MRNSFIKFSKNTFKQAFICLFCLCNSLIINAQLTIPYTFENNSRYSDNEIYIGLVGKTLETGDVWMDMSSSELQEMSASDNTIPGPDFSFPKEWLYPEIFTKLSDLENKTIQIPQGLFACRIFISFESPMYLHFHETGGYAGANLNNPGDPNDGIRWEIVELTWGDAGLWTNTSRVDAYQYPMALEVNGFSGGVTGATYEASYNQAINGAGTAQFKRIGEVLPHDEILAAWDDTVSDAYKVAKVIKDNSIDGEPIIEQPSKVAEFTANILDDYIDEIWETYKNYDLNINIGDRGTWIGRVQANDTFLFTDPADGSIATIHGKPSTINAMEGSGFLAYTPTLASENLEKHDEDLMIQAQMAAAITRHAIYTDIIDGSTQFTHDASRFFVIEPYNEYVEFFHSEAISFESQTYAFAYDDVGDHSSTIQTTFPTDVKVIIGGYGETPAPINATQNLALNGVATQSSTAFDANASRAIDGNTSGLWNDNSVTHTNLDANAWWQVDLGSTEAIGEINIFNRTDDCCINRLDNFTVSVINDTNEVTFSQSYTTAPNPFIIVNANGALGNVIRVELDDTNHLSLAEVEVYAYDGILPTNPNGDLFIEAEDFTAMSGVQLENTIDTNGGQNVGFIDNGDWMEYTVNIPSAGAYTFSTRIASVPGNGIVQIQSNGTAIGTINLEATGGWQSWTTFSTTVNLAAGMQTIRLTALNGGWNINWFEIENLNTASAKSIASSIGTVSNIQLYPIPAKNNLTIEIPNFENYSHIQIVNLNGRIMAESDINNTVTNINTNHLSSSFYLALIYKNGTLVKSLKFMK